MEPRLHPIGERRDMTPIQPLPEHTEYVDIGPLRVGIERRTFNEAIVRGRMDGDENATLITEELFQAKGVDYAGLDDTGTSIHVFDAASGDEYLRFDGFGKDPHYHYISPGRYHVAVGFDDTANGDFLRWAFRVLEERVREMLREAGATELADRVDLDEWAQGLQAARAVAGVPA